MDPNIYREQIYGIFADPSQDIPDKIDRALAVSSEFLDLPLGFVTRIDHGRQEIVQSIGDHPLLQPGESCPLEDAYCRRTVEIESPLAIQDVRDSSRMSETAVQTFGLGTYIGARVVVADETYGTVCFAATEERDAEFTESEILFVELVAGLIGQTFERRSYERELRDRENRLDERKEIYRAVIDASFDLVFRIDADGEFVYVSPPVEDLLGYTPAVFLDQPFTSMLPDRETIELGRDLFQQVLAGETVEQESFPLEHESGDRVFVDVRVTPVYEASVPSDERTPADIVGAQGMARDATDRHRREQLIRVLNRVLRHNLRNEMNVISGFAGILRDSLSGDEAGMAGRIVDASARLVTLSETARKLEQNIEKPPEIVPVDVVPPVSRAASQIGERYPNATVSVETPPDAVARCAPRFETAVWEVVDNAAKHAGQEPSVEIEVTTTDDEVVIRVTDDGPGLPTQEREVLTTGKETPLVHGSGLGLWLVHWIIESTDGKLRVGDRGSGACIEIGLERDADSLDR